MGEQKELIDNTFSDKFRPKNIKQLIGTTQKTVAQGLIDQLERGEVTRRIMLVGPSGSGKTTIGYMFVRYLLGLSEDQDPRQFLTEINGSAETGIDMVRDKIIGRMHYRSMFNEWRIFFIDEMQGLSKSAQNAMLTPMEQLGKHSIVIVCTTDPDKIIDTLRSRFVEFNLTTPERAEIHKKAVALAKKFGKAEEITLDQVDMLIDRSKGNMRKFDNWLGQLIHGTYVHMDEDIGEGEDLVKRLLFQREQVYLTDCLRLVQNNTDYSALAIGMSRYALAVLRNGCEQEVYIRATTLVKIFGDGLGYTDPYTSFAKRLIEFIEIGV